MKAYVPGYEMEAPSDLQSALKCLKENPEWKPFAGGTDLMVLFEAGALPQGKYLSILNLDELKGIDITKDFITMGALTTYREIRAHKVLQDEFKMLPHAAKLTGSLAIQSRGTIGGNIINASPAADSPPALLCYDAELELTSASNSRWVNYSNFHQGYKQMDLKEDELLTKIRLPRKTLGSIQYYHKVGTRDAQSISKVCFAGLAKMDQQKVQDIRLSWGSIASTPYRSTQVEKILKGQLLNDQLIKDAVMTLEREINPLDDIRSTAAYRMQVAKNILGHYLGQLS